MLITYLYLIKFFENYKSKNKIYLVFNYHYTKIKPVRNIKFSNDKRVINNTIALCKWEYYYKE